jgi:hypothetical protein
MITWSFVAGYCLGQIRLGFATTESLNADLQKAMKPHNQALLFHAKHIQHTQLHN